MGPDGSLYISDTFARRIRRVSPDGLISTLAGNGGEGFRFRLGGGSEPTKMGLFPMKMGLFCG